MLPVPVSSSRRFNGLSISARTTCGISRKTISSSEVVLSLLLKMYFRIGTDARPGVPLSELRHLPLQNAAQNIRLAFFQTNRLVDGALGNDRLVDAAQVRHAVLRRNLDIELQRHVAVVVNRRLHRDVHADVEILELRIDQAN